MVAVPEPNPEIIPVDPADAIVGTLLLHMPPAGDPVSDSVDPVQIEEPPVMTGVIFIVIALVAMQLPTVYVIVTAPATRPITVPVEPTVATVVLLLLHVPPAGEPESNTGLPLHAVTLPDIDAAGLTVIVLYVAQPVCM